jgi:hypothetical protein
MDIPKAVALDFPRLNLGTARRTSDDTWEYNCIAFAAADTSRPWWPNNDDSYWPEGAPQEETLPAFIAAFGTKGYSLCGDRSHETGFEKIAIYVDQTGKPTHAAHQLPDGKWESKLGSDVDIQHDSPADLTGGLYGEVVCFLKRRIGS